MAARLLSAALRAATRVRAPLFGALAAASLAAGAARSAATCEPAAPPPPEHFDAPTLVLALEDAINGGAALEYRVRALLTLAQQLRDRDSALEGAPSLVTERHVTGIASLLPRGASAPPPLRRAAAEALAELSVLPDFPPMQAEAALAPVVGCVEDGDGDVSGGALRCLHNAVMDADSRLGRWGEPLLSSLVRAYTSRAAAHPSQQSQRAADERQWALVALAGCCSKQADFPPSAYDAAGVVRAFTAAVAASVPRETASVKDAQFAATALRELGKREASPGSPVEAAFIRHRVLPTLLAALRGSPNLWTQRSVAKAVYVLQKKPGLVAAAARDGVTLETIQAALDAGAKGDFMVARWARESARWQAEQRAEAAAAAGAGAGGAGGGASPAAAPAPRRKKKWYED